jgi:hypothetical protein
MKKLLRFILISIMFLSVTSYPQDLTQSEEGLIRKEICRWIKIDAKPIDTPILGKIFYGTFYEIKLSREDPDGSIFGMGKLMLVRVDDHFVIPENIATNKSMPSLKSLLKKDLRFKNMKDAQMIQDALDNIYKISSISDKNAKGIKQKGDEWIFIRGKFFDKYKGFIFKTKDGVIVEVKYSLHIKI